MLGFEKDRIISRNSGGKRATRNPWATDTEAPNPAKVQVAKRKIRERMHSARNPALPKPVSQFLTQQNHILSKF
ncbi:MAG: hypothetical protein R8L07_21290 [Alphaproteobacteria bacterium]|nr:hypothetical protein [Alphaproteobacteria bacterium]